MRPVLSAIAAATLSLLGGTSVSSAADCPGNPDALGTSRTVVVDPLEHGRIGSMQYAETLPLKDREVVLTFDDGPIPPHTGRVLDILAAECVKATFFLVGRQAQAFPDGVRRVYDAGHTVASHSHSHPHAFAKVPTERAMREVDDGVQAVKTALGDTRVLAPFFRFPGFGRSPAMEDYVTAQGLMIWGADVPADDWMRLPAEEVVHRAISRLEQKGRGVLLLHDIQRVTVTALPSILRELKRRGFRVVHVLPAGPDRPKTVTDPSAWAFRQGSGPTWPATVAARATEAPALSTPSRLSFGFPAPFAATVAIPAIEDAAAPTLIEQARLGIGAKRIGKVVWPETERLGRSVAAHAVLPIPSADSLDLEFPRRSRPTPAKARPPQQVAAATPPLARVSAEVNVASATSEQPKLAVMTREAATAEPPVERASPAVWTRLMGWFR